MKIHFTLKLAAEEPVSAHIFILLLCIGLLNGSMATAKDTNTQRDVLAKLVHPEVAERLSLTDAQRARFQALLLERSQSLLTAESDEVGSTVRENYDQLALAEMNLGGTQLNGGGL